MRLKLIIIFIVVFLGVNAYADNKTLSVQSSPQQCKKCPTQLQLQKLKSKPKSKRSVEKIKNNTDKIKYTAEKMKKNVGQYIIKPKEKIEKAKEKEEEPKKIIKPFFYTARCGVYKYLSNAESDGKVLQNIVGSSIPTFIEKHEKLYFLYAGSSQNKGDIASLVDLIGKAGWKGCLLTRVSTKHALKQSQSLIASDVFVPPETPTKVIMSNTDVNRIVAPEYIKDVVFSKEKGVVVKFTNNNAFVKFLIKKDPEGRIEYTSTPSELYVVTEDTVYTIIAIPKRVPARTIRLMGSNLKRIQINRAMFEQLPYERGIVKVIKSVYMDKIPDSWTIENTNEDYNNVINFLNIRLIRTVKIEGEGLKLKEYLVRVKPDSNLKKIELTEKLFLKPQLAKGLVAVSLSDLKLEKADTAVLFIVEHMGEENGD